MGPVEGLLAETKVRFGKQWLARLTTRVKPPEWMEKGDGLYGLYAAQKLLLQKGRVAMAVIVQANDMLYSPAEEYDCPASVLFSEDPVFQTESGLSELQQLAYRAYSWKGIRRGGRAEMELGAALADEAGRYFNMKLPDKLAEGRDVYMTSIMVHRGQLPVPYLKENWFPLIVLPEQTKYTLICPAKFWDEDLVKLWR